MRFIISRTLLLVALLAGASRQDCTSDWLSQFLSQHNMYRARHGVPPLVLNTSLSTSFSQPWADHLLSIGQLVHHSDADLGSNYGENIFSAWYPSGSPLPADTVVDQWYGEIQYYEQYFNTGQEPDMTQYELWAHFTQVVWRDSTDLAVGCAIDSTGTTTYIVADYWPQGNIVGEFQQNVPPPISSIRVGTGVLKPARGFRPAARRGPIQPLTRGVKTRAH